MSELKLRALLGPRKEAYTRTYGKCRVHVFSLPMHQVMVYEMDGYIAAEHIDAYIDDLLAAAQTAKPRGMIADPTRMKVLSPELQRAIQTRFWPGIARLGVKRNPAIVPPAAVTQSSVKRMVATAGQTIQLDDGFQMEIALLET